jgi:hypothetical protein
MSQRQKRKSHSNADFPGTLCELQDAELTTWQTFRSNRNKRDEPPPSFALDSILLFLLLVPFFLVLGVVCNLHVIADLSLRHLVSLANHPDGEYWQ